MVTGLVEKENNCFGLVFDGYIQINISGEVSLLIPSRTMVVPYM